MDFRSRQNVREKDDIREEPLLFMQSQYSASRKMLHIVASLRAQMDARAGYLLFRQEIFNILSARGVGLDIWGRILAMPRIIQDNDTGFAVTLDDEHYRLLLLYKALANIMEATIPALSKLIGILYPEITTYVITIEDYAANLDGVFYNKKPMHIRWVFLKYFSAMEMAVFKAAGTLCRGGGVGWHLYTIEPDAVFGFDGSGLQPFNQGIFDPVGLVTL